jgi:hypothetical protein
MKYIGEPELIWRSMNRAALEFGALACGVLWLLTLGAFKGRRAYEDWEELLDRLEHQYKANAASKKENL